MNAENFVQTRRYYHAAILEGDYSQIPKTFYAKWRIQEDREMNFESTNSIIRLLRMVSPYQYFGGEVNNSQNYDGKPPYFYQIIAIECIKPNVLVLCFPLKKITIDLITSLWKEFSISRSSRFVTTDLSKLIHLFDESTDIEHNDSLFNLTGIHVKKDSEGSGLSSIKLTGVNPLDSEIYTSYLKDKLDGYTIEKETIRCRFPIKSSIRIDKHGNYRIYIQDKGKNVLSIAVILKMLEGMQLLGKTLINPVLHINEAEDNE